MTDSVFTPEQVVNLWQSQFGPWRNEFDPNDTRPMLHPFTCGNRGDHPLMAGDNGVLVPTVRGWICPFCDYAQDWAHGFMKGGIPAAKEIAPPQAAAPTMVSRLDLHEGNFIDLFARGLSAVPNNFLVYTSRTGWLDCDAQGVVNWPGGRQPVSDKAVIVTVSGKMSWSRIGGEIDWSQPFRFKIIPKERGK